MMNSTESTKQSIKGESLPKGSTEPTKTDDNRDILPISEVKDEVTLSLKDLKNLSTEAIEAIPKRNTLESNIRAKDANNKFKTGFYNQDEKYYLVIPEDVMKQEDKYLGGMIYDLCRDADINLKVLENVNVQLSPTFNEEFIKGLWLGFYSTTTQKRKRNKTEYELGRTCAYSLIVRAAFEDIKQLGLSSLVKDQFFFGNNPNEKVNKVSVQFKLKTFICTMFTDQEIGEAIFKMLNKAAHRISNELTDEELNKAIADNLDPIAHVISRNYHSEDVKVGKRVVRKIRKPNPIKNSPLMLKEEVNLFHKLSSSVFSDLKVFTENYENQVFNLGYASITKRISDIIRDRWELLAQFAKITKNRLQDIRKYSNKAELKKAEVSQKEVELFLEKVPDVCFRLQSEILSVIPIDYLRRSIEKEYRIYLSDPEDIKAYIMNLIYKLYKNIDEDKKYKTTIVSEEPITVKSLTGDFESALGKFDALTKKRAALQFNSVGAFSCKSYKLINRDNQIKDLVPAIERILQSLEGMDKYSVETACWAYFEGIYTSFAEYARVSREESNIAQRRFYNDLTARRKISSDDILERILKKPNNSSNDGASSSS